MSGIAQELEAKLRSLDTDAARSLERLVRNAIDLVEQRQSLESQPARLPSDFFAKISEAFGPEPLERPPQGITEEREQW